MNYRSVCTGIAAETVAWHPLGWKPLSFSEIDPFCSTLLKFRYPEVHNFGDFTKIQEQEQSTDLLMGGTPCQSFSIAGKRAGLDDARGNLAIEFIRLALRLRPRWIVWENVKGVMSSDEGRTFEAFLGTLAECGYGFAYRVLDAQFDALAQRRERVFVVGYLGDWRPPAAVLFERESLRRDTAPGRKAGQEVAGVLRSGSHGGSSHGKLSGSDQVPMVSMTLNAHGGAGRLDGESETFVIGALPSRHSPKGHGAAGVNNQEVNAGHLVIHGAQITNKDNRSQPADQDELSPTLRSSDGSSKDIGILQRTAVRRLTPKEWERLMGFEDDYTLIPYPTHSKRTGKPLKRTRPAADGPRYKAIGNSISVPTLRWIGRRIAVVDSLMAETSRNPLNSSSPAQKTAPATPARPAQK